MSKFSIDELFPNETDKQNKIYQPAKPKKVIFDLDTLFKNDDDDKTEFVFDSQTLLKNTEALKNKLEKYYNKSYIQCCKYISNANNHNVTDILFEVTEYANDCYEYNSLDCLRFIEKKLNAEYIDTYIIDGSRTKIFITWKNLDKKLNTQKK